MSELPEVRGQISNILGGAWGEDNIVTADGMFDAVLCLNEQPVSCVLLSNTVDGIPPAESVAEILDHVPPSTPVLVFGDPQNAQERLSSIVAGSQDFLEPSELDAISLDRRIRFAMERKRSEAELREAAGTDLLTGLANRRRLEPSLRKALAITRNSGDRLGVLCIDIDQFKRINDTMGHRVGDIAIREVAKRLSKCTAPQDSLIRIGGDEFLIVAPGRRSLVEFEKLSSAIISAMEPPFEYDGNETSLTVSIGIAAYPVSGRTGDELLDSSDAAMYKAKQNGRNCRVWHRQEDRDLEDRKRELTDQLHYAIRDSALELAIQPQFRVEDQTLRGGEVLTRWRLDDGTWISPGAFIEVAERNGMIHDLSLWLIDEIVRFWPQWEKIRPDSDCLLSFNVSGVLLRNVVFVDEVLERLSCAGINPGELELEITETALAGYERGTISAIQTAMRAGMSVAIDDFGTGYSSFEQIKSLPFDVLKLSQALMQGVASNPRDEAIARAILEMGRAMGVEVIAEGVETPEELAFLEQHFCPTVQGYLLGKPMLKKAFIEHFERLAGAVVKTPAALRVVPPVRRMQ